MHRQLREREPDTLGIEGCINSFIGIKINAPVIGTFYPYTHNDIDTAISQRTQGYERSRFVQNTCILCKNGFDHSLYMLVIASVFHTESPFHTTRRLITDIGYHAAAQ